MAALYKITRHRAPAGVGEQRAALATAAGGKGLEGTLL